MKKQNTKHPISLIVLAITLWVVSAVIAFLLIIPILDSIITIYAAFWADPRPLGEAYFIGASIRQIGVLALAMLFVIGIIGGAEHLVRNFNTPVSWHFIIMIYAVEISLFLFTLSF